MRRPQSLRPPQLPPECSDLPCWARPSHLARKGTVSDCPIVTGRLAPEAGGGTRRLWPTGLCSPAGPPYSPGSGPWLGVSGPGGRTGREPPEQPEETMDPSSSAIFELSAPHRAEAARRGTTETSAPLLAAGLGHREGGRGEGCSLEPQARSAAPSARCTPLPELEGAGSRDPGEAARVSQSPSS